MTVKSVRGLELWCRVSWQDKVVVVMHAAPAKNLPPTGHETCPCVYVQVLILLPESREGYSE